MTTEEFKQSRTNTFHINFIKYLSLMASEEELKKVRENNLPVTIQLPEGTYTIKWKDLVHEVLEEMTLLTEELPDKINEILNISKNEE